MSILKKMGQKEGLSPFFTLYDRIHHIGTKHRFHTMTQNNKKLIPILILVSTAILFCNTLLADDFIQVSGLIEFRTQFSDGVHSLEYLTKLAKERGFDALFINDHDRIVLEYGLRPFQNILKKRVERPSINKGKPENYLSMIKEASKKYPEMILIPGTESSPFYYWRGSYFKKNLTVCDWEKHLIIVGLERPEDYKGLPILHNGFSTRYISPSALLGPILLLFPLIISLFMIKKRGLLRYLGIPVFVIAALLLINDLPFKSSPFDQYHGPQGIRPYQLLINYVNSRGGMVFWNHPETMGGGGKIDFIFKDTPPYPRVLTQSQDYTGFAALYGDGITVTEPGNLWDKVLMEYCSGQRTNPVWGISTAGFHMEGGAGEKLGNFPTVFLVKSKTKKDILEAMKKGRMYALRGHVDLPGKLFLEDFSISDPETSQKAVMGEEIALKGYPQIKIRVSTSNSEEDNSLSLRLIRSGKLLRIYSAKTSLSVDFRDEFFESGKKIYYRLDAKDIKGRLLVSNPIFVNFKGQKSP